PKAIDPPKGCRSNHEVIAALAARVGGKHPAFSMSPREIIDWTLRESGLGDLERLERERWLDLQPPFEESHFLTGFGFPDRKFRFKPDWTGLPIGNDGMRGPWRAMPGLPDYWPVNEAADEDHPSNLRPRPPETSSIPPSPRRRPRCHGSSGPRCSSIRPMRRGSVSPRAMSCNWATSAAEHACTPACSRA